MMRAHRAVSFSSLRIRRLTLPLLAGLLGIGMLAAPSTLADDAFDRRAMLQSIVDNVIKPGQAAFVDASDQLAAAAELFVAARDEESLAGLQSAWRSAADAWEHIALYNMDLWLTALHNQIDKRPANIAFIEDILAGDGELNEASVDGMGSTSRGLPALEYLIFAAEEPASAIAASFESQRRRQYLLALARNIAAKARETQAYWSPAGRDYGARFAKTDQAGGAVQGSINMLANKIFVQLEQDLQMWLGAPAGIATGQAPAPDLVEARRSGHSLAHIVSRLQGIQALFNGGWSDGDENLGFDDYLDFLGASYDDGPLSAAINERLEAALLAAAAIDAPLAVAVVDAPEAVAALYDSMRQALILLRADFKSQLSILITFSDLDGDQ